MAAVVKQMAQMSMMDKVRTLTGLGRVAATNPAAQIMAPKIGPASGSPPRSVRSSESSERRRNAAAAARNATGPGRPNP